MKIDYHRSFEKQYKKLSEPLKEKVKVAVKLFSENPNNEKLRNHALKGRMKGKRSITVTGNLRIIFEEMDSYTLVLFLSIGGHDEVYR